MNKFKIGQYVLFKGPSTDETGEPIPAVGTIGSIQAQINHAGMLVTYTMTDGTEVLESMVLGEVVLKKQRPSRSKKALAELKAQANGHAEATQ